MLANILFLTPVVGGALFSLLSVWAARRLLRWRLPQAVPSDASAWPGVSVLKPCFGLDEGLEENLESFCRQDYPGRLQILLCLQRANDPARPIAERLAARYPALVTMVITQSPPVVNGKIQNLLGGLRETRHDIAIISDSDVRVAPDYVRQMVRPLADEQVGYVCSLYRVVAPRSLGEQLEALTFNADFVPQILFTEWMGAADYCLGASLAYRRSDLAKVGGLEAVADYMVEDYEIGRRLLSLGKRRVLIPHMVDMRASLPTFAAWWSHQVYWDQNTKVANPAGFIGTILTRAIPFALLFALARRGDDVSIAVVIATVLIRNLCSKAVMDMIGDRDVRKLWLLPFRDCLVIGSWALALVKRTFIWRGLRFRVNDDGRIIPGNEREAQLLGVEHIS